MQFRAIAVGYCFLEAPRAVGNAIWFSDLVLGGMRRLSPDGSIAEYLPDRKRIGGAVVNEDGAIICGGPGGLAWLDPASGMSGMLLEHIDSQPIDCVNDLHPDGAGGLYFGTSHLDLLEAEKQEPRSTSLYRLDPDGRVTLLQAGLQMSNGIGLSPDGKCLYHNESLRGTFVYDVQADGSLANRRLFSAQEDCDGLAVDSDGGVWIACFASSMVLRVGPDGALHREVVPVRDVTSLCFGGADGRDMYVTTAGNEGINAVRAGVAIPRTAGLYHARSAVPGLPVPDTTFGRLAGNAKNDPLP